MTGRKVLIEEMPNTDYVYVHFNFRLVTTAHAPHFMRPLQTDGDYWDSLDAEAQRVVAALFTIEGTYHVVVYPHRVSIEKGRLFDFASVSGAIARALKDVFDDLEVEVKPLSQRRPFRQRRWRQIRAK